MYATRLKSKWLSYAPARPIDTTVLDIERYKMALHLDEKLSARTANNYLATLKTLFGWMRHPARRYLPPIAEFNPFEGVEHLREPVGRDTTPVTIDEDEAAILRANLPTPGVVLFEVALRTGLRRKELIFLDVAVPVSDLCPGNWTADSENFSIRKRGGRFS